jgi:hypothetical protein
MTPRENRADAHGLLAALVRSFADSTRTIAARTRLDPEQPPAEATLWEASAEILAGAARELETLRRTNGLPAPAPAEAVVAFEAADGTTHSLVYQVTLGLTPEEAGREAIGLATGEYGDRPYRVYVRGSPLPAIWRPAAAEPRYAFPDGSTVYPRTIGGRATDKWLGSWAPKPEPGSGGVARSVAMTGDNDVVVPFESAEEAAWALARFGEGPVGKPRST